MANNFFVKNSLYITSCIALIMLGVLALFWNQMPVTQRIIGVYFILIAAHEWEEMKFPGGFVEMVIKMTGMPVTNMTIPKFCLFLITVYTLIIPFCLPNIHWLVIGPLFLGLLEPIAHLAMAKSKATDKFYSPGMITSLLFMIPVDIYTIYYLATQESFHWSRWIFAILLLMIPLIAIQRFIVVVLLKMNYKEFMKSAFQTLTGKRQIK